MYTSNTTGTRRCRVPSPARRTQSTSRSLPPPTLRETKCHTIIRLLPSKMLLLFLLFLLRPALHPRQADHHLHRALLEWVLRPVRRSTGARTMRTTIRPRTTAWTRVNQLLDGRRTSLRIKLIRISRHVCNPRCHLFPQRCAHNFAIHHSFS